ncbi:hypothetical protein Y1Q_0006127 [Alligator mississippiensis]|uniref:Uncharacterized protein n=1 Tax=Alligator mississippiensis TaxID=8496 RepID=A0A151N4E6_ALLMI|nr:hypothetical protein Y1Q_0006127 [Alligator mississippiensis]
MGIVLFGDLGIDQDPGGSGQDGSPPHLGRDHGPGGNGRAGDPLLRDLRKRTFISQNIQLLSVERHMHACTQPGSDNF